MPNLKNYLCAGLAIALVWFWYAAFAAEADLAAERAAHVETRQALAEALKEGLRWKHTAGVEAAKLPAFQMAATACLMRENAARADAVEREEIMREAVPEPLPEAAPPQKRMLDDATRRKVAARLNRPL